MHVSKDGCACTHAHAYTHTCNNKYLNLYAYFPLAAPMQEMYADALEHSLVAAGCLLLAGKIEDNPKKAADM